MYNARQEWSVCPILCLYVRKNIIAFSLIYDELLYRYYYICKDNYYIIHNYFETEDMFVQQF